MPPTIVAGPRDQRRRPRARVVALSGRAAARPAIPAQSLLRQVGRVAAWTGFWTLYQWWAVIGWPEGPGAIYASMASTGLAGLLAAGVWRDVRRARQPLARVFPLRRASAAKTAPEDLAA
jgi:hypothetical protein